MDFLSRITITVCVFCFHDGNALVVTKYNTNIITKYLESVRKFSSDETIESFFKINTTEYCRDLRRAYIYSSITISFDEQPVPERNVRVITDRVPKYLMEIEQNETAMPMRTFKDPDSNLTLNLHSFVCLNTGAEPMWFIAPAFVPDSAFLFEVEPRFRDLVTREIEGNNKILAKLIAIVDENFTETRPPKYRENILDRYLRTSNYSGRDKICDLNPVVQVRLCALVSLPRIVRNGSSDIYYHRDGGCKSVPLQRDDVEINDDIVNSSFTQEMLHCSIHISEFGLSSFYLGLLGKNSSQMIYLHSGFIDGTKWRIRMFVYTVPILNHLDIYQKISNDI